MQLKTTLILGITTLVAAGVVDHQKEEYSTPDKLNAKIR